MKKLSTASVDLEEMEFTAVPSRRLREESVLPDELEWTDWATFILPLRSSLDKTTKKNERKLLDGASIMAPKPFVPELAKRDSYNIGYYVKNWAADDRIRHELDIQSGLFELRLIKGTEQKPVYVGAVHYPTDLSLLDRYIWCCIKRDCTYGQGPTMEEVIGSFAFSGGTLQFVINQALYQEYLVEVRIKPMRASASGVREELDHLLSMFDYSWNN